MPCGQPPPCLVGGGKKPPFDLSEMDVVIVPQAIACPAQVEDFGGPQPRRPLEAGQEGLSALLDLPGAETLPGGGRVRHAQKEPDEGVMARKASLRAAAQIPELAAEVLEILVEAGIEAGVRTPAGAMRPAGGCS